MWLFSLRRRRYLHVGTDIGLPMCALWMCCVLLRPGEVDDTKCLFDYFSIQERTTNTRVSSTSDHNQSLWRISTWICLPGSPVFFSRAMLKSWVEPGDEASYYVLTSWYTHHLQMHTKLQWYYWDGTVGKHLWSGQLLSPMPGNYHIQCTHKRALASTRGISTKHKSCYCFCNYIYGQGSVHHTTDWKDTGPLPF